MSVGGGTAAINLPLITPRNVPKRYEETRPVLIQGCAHSRIIGLGHELHRKELEKAEHDKLGAIRVAEQAVWEEAEKIKQVALEKAREDATHEQERVIKKLKKAHAKAILEEALKVEMAMQKLAIEQVKQERMEGEKRLQAAVKTTEERCHKQLLEAVAKARQEEQKTAADEAARVKQENQKKFDTAMKQAENEKTLALKELRDAKDLEKARAVQEAEMRERRISREKVEALTRQYEAVITDLRQEIEEKKNEIKQLIGQNADTERQKTQVENCLLDTRKDFQDFIDNLPPYDKTQADFMLPRVYLDELEHKGYQITMLRPPVKKMKKKK